jgi:alcohol dehydrogenase
VLMGSMIAPLPISYLEVMLNDLEILGQFMYPRNAFIRLIELARSGLLDISAIRTRCFPLEALPGAMETAAKAEGLECVVVKMS